MSLAALDRAGERRRDTSWLDAVWRDPATQALLVRDGRFEVTSDGALRLRPAHEVTSLEGERYLLGVADGGTTYVALHTAQPWEALGIAEVLDLRAALPGLSPLEAGLVTHAVGLANWHAAHPRCSRCGAPTVSAVGGAERHCPECGAEHHPRTDPAVIMTVTDDAGRVLLGHNPRWPAGRYSTLAGFVEPGETAERAVIREVLEEAAVHVSDVTYLGSQPWPFPASLMLGYTARASDPSTNLADGVELIDARWFAPDELLAAVLAGDVLLPPRISIARRLIEHWYGGPLPDAPSPW